MKRSSPHQKFTFDQLTAGAAAENVSNSLQRTDAYRAAGLSTTVASPYLSCTSTSLVIRRAAMAAIRTERIRMNAYSWLNAHWVEHSFLQYRFVAVQ